MNTKTHCPYCEQEIKTKSMEVYGSAICYKCGIQWNNDGKRTITTEWNGWHEVPEGILIIRKEKPEC